MPTNLLRRTSPRAPASRRPAAVQPRLALIAAGKAGVRVKLMDTPTADRLWAALPLFSFAEPWGDSLHFGTPIETGRERGARMLCELGDICFWISEDRVIIPFGRTPISRPGEIRLPSICNLWARALDDVRVLKAVRPGDKVEVRALAAAKGTGR